MRTGGGPGIGESEAKKKKNGIDVGIQKNRKDGKTEVQ